MKTIYLVRHGEAGDVNLTPCGREQIKETARKLKLELFGLEAITIYHSPLQRATQSAQVMAENLKPMTTKLQPENDLYCDSYNIGAVVSKAESPAIIVSHQIVSHQPDIARYLAAVTGRLRKLSNGEYVKVDVS